MSCSTVKLTVMCSASGTNLQALIDAVAAGSIPNASIIKVVVNRKTAYAAKRAEQAGIPAEYFNLVNGRYHKAGEKDEAVLKTARAKYDADLAQRVLKDSPDMVVLAGWMHVFSEPFLKPLDAAGIPVINLHPALPGKYDGANAIQRAHEDFQAGRLENNKTGCMIHYVIAEVDRGEPILVEEVECREGETLEGLENRIHAVEHRIIVKATAQVATRLAATKTGRGRLEAKKRDN
ncbi:phosphoribosylglycinamide formyltransferase [Zalerion maritima]|uniref:Phosphoribosylglycinamide formyltransferase n=1 Tax=Zalerion maritima TaxID=339359 RepID=A0AAD5RTT6_9PEZI|nr:phosphoribosylglycinamide formyltransferase [Zalerion maritima]